MIDVHSHICPAELPSIGRVVSSRWPCMCDRSGTPTLMIGDAPFRELDARSWSVEARLEDMNRDGVTMQVLSPMPELLSYWFATAETQVLCDSVNAAIATMVSEKPDRFAGLGMLPLQDPEAAAREIAGLRARFGLLGVEIGSNINGAMLGDPQFDRFYAAAEDHGMAVFVHALHPLSTRDARGGLPMTALVGFPSDVGIAAASIIHGGVLDRFPGLRIAFSHGGGTLSAIIGRMDQGWEISEGAARGHQKPSLVARQFYFDSNVYDGCLLRHIMSSLAPEHVFLGTDYPYPIMQTDPAAYLAQGASDLQSVANGAAKLFLGVD